MFGKDVGVSLVANGPNIGFNSYFSGSWKSLSPGWSTAIGVDQSDGSMNFLGAPTKSAAADTALTFANRLSIHADGKLVSSMWRATQVMNQRQGPMPVNASFVSGGGTLVIFFSGSGFSSGATNIGLVVLIDGSSIGTTRSFTNEGGSHKAFTTNIIVQPNVAAGAHSISLSALVGTNSDGNDWYNVAILELPF